MLKPNKNMEIKGLFYLPSKKENELVGFLKINDGEMPHLEIIGNLYEKQSYSNPIELIICGHAENGKQITLINCYLNEHSLQTSGFTKYKFDIESVILGQTFSSLEEIFISSINESPKFLIDWLDLKPITNHYDKLENSFQMKYTKPDDIIIDLNDSIIFSLNFNYIFPINSNSNYQSFEYFVNSRLSFKNPIPFEELSITLFKIKQFYSILLFRNFKSHNIQLQFKDRSSTWSDFKRFLTNTDDFEIDKSFGSHFKYLINYKEIRDDLPILLKNWFENFHLFNPIISSLYVYMYMNETTVELKFLTIIQALESFHRRTQNNDINKDEFYKKLKRITDMLEKEDAAWLKNKLHFGFEPTLHSRLEYIFAEIKSLGLDSFFSHIENPIKKVKDTRNYLTHFESSLESKILSFSEMIFFTDRFAIVLVFLILKELGITKTSLLKIIQRHKNTNFTGFL